MLVAQRWPKYLTRFHHLTYLTVGVVTQRLMSLVKHYAVDVLGRTCSLGQVILHHLGSQEEHSLQLPHPDTILGRHLT